MSRAASYREEPVYSGFVDEPEAMSDARITAQLGYLEEQISKTAVMVCELVDRIGPVMLPAFPSAAEVAGPSPQQSSSVSITLDGIAQQVNDLQRRIGNATERVQL